MVGCRLQLLSHVEGLANQGIHHGDLRPANVCVSEAGRVRLVDLHLMHFDTDCDTYDCPFEEDGDGEVSELRARLFGTSSLTPAAESQL